MGGWVLRGARARDPLAEGLGRCPGSQEGRLTGGKLHFQISSVFISAVLHVSGARPGQAARVCGKGRGSEAGRPGPVGSEGKSIMSEGRIRVKFELWPLPSFHCWPRQWVCGGPSWSQRTSSIIEWAGKGSCFLVYVREVSGSVAQKGRS